MGTDRSSNKTVSSAEHHLVFCPKYRRRVLVGRVERRLKEIVAGVSVELDGELIELERLPDHVHRLVRVPPVVPLSGLVRLLEGGSSRLRRWPGRWSPSWFVSTVAGAPLEVVRRSVEHQEQVA